MEEVDLSAAEDFRFDRGADDLVGLADDAGVDGDAFAWR